MQEVTERREIDASPADVRTTMADTEAFMRAGGFDEVEVEDDRIHLGNNVGLLTIELDLRSVDEADSDFCYEQVEGIFESMVTRFVVEENPEGGVTVVATTEFALDASIVGPILDATVIKRQRRRELAGHFDYLEATATAAEDPLES